MPNLNDDLLGDEGDELDDNGAPEGDPSKAGKDPKSTDKRISDLQSAKDKETARANKLQKQLDAMLAAAKDESAEEGKPAAPAAGSGVDSFVLDMAKMFVFQQHPRLSEFGLTAADLTGTTPGEIAQSATALVARYDKLATSIRNKVLADNGLAPEIADTPAPPSKAKDFSKMSSEDFKKVMDEALSRR